jgi:hypothetical protein
MKDNVVNIDGMLYEKQEDSSGKIIFVPVEGQNRYTFEFTAREINLLSNILYILMNEQVTWMDYDDGRITAFSNSAKEAMSDISDQFENWAEDRNNTDGRDPLVGNKKDFKIAEWQNQ